MATVWKQQRLQWRELEDGIEIAKLHRHVEGGGAALFRLKAGATMREHDHVAGEHSYVIEGVVDFGSERLEAGDALWVEVGERHEVTAVTDAIFLAVSPPKRAASGTALAPSSEPRES